jgi:hypothetical protein
MTWMGFLSFTMHTFTCGGPLYGAPLFVKNSVFKPGNIINVCESLFGHLS